MEESRASRLPWITAKDFEGAQGLEFVGSRELFISGSIRSSKSMYGARKCLEVEYSIDGRGLEFYESDKESIARQQPLSGIICSGAQKRADWPAETGADHKHIVDAKERFRIRLLCSRTNRSIGSEITSKALKNSRAKRSMWPGWTNARRCVSETIRFRLLDRKGCSSSRSRQSMTGSPRFIRNTIKTARRC